MTQTQMNALNLKASAYFSLKAEIDRLQEQLDAIKDELRLATIDNDNTIVGDGWKASYSEYTKNQFSSKALKEAEPELYNLFVKPTPSQTFTIKRTA